MKRLLSTITILTSMALAISAAGKPAPPDPPKKAVKAKTPAERLPCGPTNWGTMQAVGGDFTLTMHPQWEAIADMRTRKDGSVYWLCIWTLSSNGQTAPGIYEFDEEGILTGTWGYSGSCEITDDGRLTGSTMGDRIYRVEPAPPIQ